MASLSEAFPPANDAAQRQERAENPQTYDAPAYTVRHVKEARHILGMVAGNEVSRIAGNQADLESDLRGITRPLTDCPTREHLPPTGEAKIARNNPKTTLTIDTTPLHLPERQAWAYPVVLAPVPLEKETCGRPEKY